MAITSYFSKYYDDINVSDVNGLTPEQKNYLRILFQPGRSVQSRELNQLQSLLQLQIDRLGQSLFVPNSPIKAGVCSFDADLKYVDVEIGLNEYTEFVRQWLLAENNWPGNPNYKNNLTLTQVGTTSLAIITKSEKLISNSETHVRYRLFIKFKSKYIDDNGETVSTFEVREDRPLRINNLLSDISFNVSPIVRNPNEPVEKLTYIGKAVAATISPGIYFTKGTAVLSHDQYVTYELEEFIDEGEQTYSPEEYFTGSVILKVEENKITNNDDRSLEDNAAGSLNYAAPGADRYQINLILEINPNFSEGSTDIEFKDAIRVLNIKDNNVIKEYDGNDNLKVIKDVLALRTYEESGDYILAPFKTLCNAVWREQGNSGKFNAILDLEDSMIPYMNRSSNYAGINFPNPGIRDTTSWQSNDWIAESQDWFAITLDPSVAYVKGHRVEINEPNILLAQKARATYNNIEGEYKQTYLSANLGNYIEVESPTTGLPNIDETVEYSLYGRTADDDNQAQEIVATTKIQSIERSSSILRLYLYDIQFNSNYRGNFDSITKISSATLDGYGTFEADLVTPAQLKDIANYSSIYELPYTVVKDVNNIEVNEKISYIEDVEPNATVTFTASSGEIFDISNLEVLFIDPTTPPTTSYTNLSANDYDITITASNSITLDLKKWSDRPDNLTACSVRIIITVNRNLDDENVTQGIKKLKVETKTLTFTEKINAGDIITLPGVYHLEEIQQIDSVTPIEFEIETDGQQPAQYVQATIKSLKDFELPNNDILEINVKIKHWEFTGGDYYLVSSYIDQNDNRIPLNEIPTYNGKSLGDALDFRKIETSTNRIALDPYSPIKCDVDFYLPRKDYLIVLTNGTFNILQGQPDINPKYPAIPEDALVLHKIDIDPYVFKLKDNVHIASVDNRRYTMRDIGALDRRIGVLEYYTTLSLLEKAADSEIISDASGERFKNGFVVDSFKGHNVGDPTQKNYRCSINRKTGTLYPHFSSTNIPFKIKDHSALNANSEYKSGIHDKTLSLKYTPIEYINQPFATQYISVQPYEATAVAGNLKLYPSFDTWVDTITAPEPTQLDLFSGIYDNIRILAEETGILGTEHSEWLDVGNTNTSEIEDETGTFLTTTVTQDQTRSGKTINISLEDEINQSLGKYISDIQIRPYMRSRLVMFKAVGLTPNARFFATFDNINVDAYCYNTNSTRSVPYVNAITGTPTSGTEWDALHAIMDDASLTGLDESTLIEAVNELLGQTIGQVALTSNSKGQVYGAFIIPNNDQLKFIGGEKTFKLSDSIRKVDQESFATFKFLSSGFAQTQHENIISTQPIQIGVDNFTESRTEIISENRTEIITDPPVVNPPRVRVDPLAQSFIIPDSTGIYITDIDLFFAKKPSDNNESVVEVYLVNTLNGVPNKFEIPGSRVAKTKENVITSDDSSVATKFIFNDPIYLSPGEEYAVVIFSESSQYKLWISESGATSADILTGQIIKHQPFSGVFFTSSNASAWVTEANKNLKFILNRAKFNKSPATLTAQPILPTSLSHISVTSRGINYDLGDNISVTITRDIADQEFDNINVFDTYDTNSVSFNAEADAALNLTNGIDNIKLTKKGIGYLKAPSITIVNGGGEGQDASAIAHLERVNLSSLLLNQSSIVVNKTSVTNKLKLGPDVDNQTYIIQPAVPFNKLRKINHYIENNYDDGLKKLNSYTELEMILKTDDDRVSPIIDRESLSLTARTYTISNDEENTSHYYTKKIFLQNPADQIDGFLSINRPSGAADVKAYVSCYDDNDEKITYTKTNNLLKVSSSDDNTELTLSQFNSGDQLSITTTITNVSDKPVNGIRISLTNTGDYVIPSGDPAGLTDTNASVLLNPGESASFQWRHIITTDDAANGFVNYTDGSLFTIQDVRGAVVDNESTREFTSENNSSFVGYLREKYQEEWWNVPILEPLTIPINSEEGRKQYFNVRYQKPFDFEFNSFIVKLVLCSENIVEVPSIKNLRFIASI